MKKTIVLTSSLLLLTSLFASAESHESHEKQGVWDELTAQATFGFESEQVDEGQQAADAIITNNLELSLNGIYGGVETTLPVHDDSNKNYEVNFYIGYTTLLENIITLDIGYTYNWFPENRSNEDNVSDTHEYSLSLSLEAPFNPSISFANDIDKDQIILELSTNHTVDLASIAANTELELNAYLGMVDTDDLGADQTSNTRDNRSDANGYTYWGVSADYIYNFSDNAQGSLGVRYAANNDGDSGIDNQTGDRESNLWWGLAFSAGF